MPGKPKVQIDEDGDNDIDVTVEIDTPVGTWPPGVRNALIDLVARMEVHLPPGRTRVSFAQARETLRTIVMNNP